MDWNKSTADCFLKGIFTYLNNESLRDLHLSHSMAFNPHVHSTAFVADARALLEKSTVGYVAIKCSRRWGESIVFPSTATIKELAKEHNIPLEVHRCGTRVCGRRHAGLVFFLLVFAFSRWCL